MTEDPNHLQNLLHRFIRNLLAVFSLNNLPLHALAIVLTLILYRTGLDLRYYALFRDAVLYPVSFSAAIIGGLAPVFFR